MKTEPSIHTSTAQAPNHIERRAIYGYELEAGDVLEEDDMYESSSGYWVKCVCPGLTLQEGFPVKWVRPCR